MCKCRKEGVEVYATMYIRLYAYTIRLSVYRRTCVYACIHLYVYTYRCVYILSVYPCIDAYGRDTGIRNTVV